jgi:hypothetical protein
MQKPAAQSTPRLTRRFAFPGGDSFETDSIIRASLNHQLDEGRAE